MARYSCILHAFAMGPAPDSLVSFESLVSFNIISQSVFSEEESRVVDIEGFGGETDWLIDLPDVEELMSLQAIANATLVPTEAVAPTESRVLPLEIPGLRTVPDPDLVVVGHGQERQRSEHNDNWALKRVNVLRGQLGWDVNIPLGDLPLERLDELFSTLFSRVTKVDGTIYPGASLMNMLNAFNRIIKRASEIFTRG